MRVWRSRGAGATGAADAGRSDDGGAAEPCLGDRPQGLVPAGQWRAVRATDDRRQLCAVSAGADGGRQHRRGRGATEFEQAFEENGLPEIMRSDNGSPFASPGVTGLTRLSAWWAKLGIRHERTAPGKPQQNGRQERFHLTLLEATEPPAADRGGPGRALRRIPGVLQPRTAARSFGADAAGAALSAVAAAIAEASAGAGVSSGSRCPPGALERRDQMGGRLPVRDRGSGRRMGRGRGERNRSVAHALL